jgi:homoserine kinase
LALSLRNELRLAATDDGLSVTVRGEGRSSIPEDENNLALRAAERLFQVAGRRPAGLRLWQQNRVPVGSGLGSSAAAVVGGLLAANALSNAGLEREDLLSLAADIEGHPDNAAAALFGGLVLVVRDGRRWLVEQIAVPEMEVVVVLPDFRLSTAEARAVLPDQAPLASAVFNAGRVGLLIRALAAGDYTKLGVAMQDCLHQPYRLPLIPGMAAAFEAARDSGAASVALSGAGPAVVAFGPSYQEQVAAAIREAFGRAGLSSRSWSLPVDHRGCLVTTSE